MFNITGYSLFLLSHLTAVILAMIFGSWTTGYLYSAALIMALYALGTAAIIKDEIQSDLMEFDSTFIKSVAASITKTPIVPVCLFLFPLIIQVAKTIDRIRSR